MYKNVFKRLFDILISLFLLILLFPIIILTALLLALHNNGKVFFCQVRPGLFEKQFLLYKFKTMNDKSDKFGNVLPDEQRLTFAGRIIRKLSLDELPQLFNVIKGDMSLIGPRPLLVEYLLIYNEVQKLRHNVRPGITGWAQVNGRNSLSWEEKFNLDIWYVKNLSLGVDIKIYFLTILKILKREGVSKEGFATAPKFDGFN